MNTQEHKTRKRRFWSFCLTLVFLLCSVMPMTALATEYSIGATSSNDFGYFEPDDILRANDVIKTPNNDNSFKVQYLDYEGATSNLYNSTPPSDSGANTYKLLNYNAVFPSGDSSKFAGWKVIEKTYYSRSSNNNNNNANSNLLKLQAVAKPVVSDNGTTRDSVTSATVKFESTKLFVAYQYIISDDTSAQNNLDWSKATKGTNISDNTNDDTAGSFTITAPEDSPWNEKTKLKVWIKVQDKDKFKSEAENTSQGGANTLDDTDEVAPSTGKEIWSDPVAITIGEFEAITVEPTELSFSTPAGTSTSKIVKVTNHTDKTLYLTASYIPNQDQPDNLYTFTWGNDSASGSTGTVNGKSNTTLNISSNASVPVGTYGGKIVVTYNETNPNGNTDSDNSDATTQSLSLLNLNSGISMLDDLSGGDSTAPAGSSITGTKNIPTIFTVTPAGGGGGGGSSSTTKYTLTYDTNGGKAMKAERYEKNTNVGLSKKIPTRDGYTFVGWFEDEALSKGPIDSVTMKKDTTIYAAWAGGTPLNPDDPNGNGGGNGVPGALNGKDHIAYMNGYEDGTIKPNKNITRAEAATLFFRMLNEDVRAANYSTVSPFIDVNEDDWFNIAVATMAKMGILKGRTADTYEPNEPITRAEFATICARFDTNNPDTSEVGFNDLAGHWAEADVLRAAALGWVEGYEDGSFRPDAFITRAEVITMMNRLLCRIPETVEDLLDGMKTWPDVAETDWFYIAIQEATNGHTYLYKDQENHERWLELTDDTEPGEE